LDRLLPQLVGGNPDKLRVGGGFHLRKLAGVRPAAERAVGVLEEVADITVSETSPRSSPKCRPWAA
jgi:hypothetical protein